LTFCDADLKGDGKIDPEDVRRDGRVRKRKGKRQCFFLFLKKNRVYVVKSIFLILISRRIIIENSIFLHSN